MCVVVTLKPKMPTLNGSIRVRHFVSVFCIVHFVDCLVFRNGICFLMWRQFCTDSFYIRTLFKNLSVALSICSNGANTLTVCDLIICPHYFKLDGGHVDLLLSVNQSVCPSWCSSVAQMFGREQLKKYKCLSNKTLWEYLSALLPGAAGYFHLPEIRLVLIKAKIYCAT